MTPFKKKNMRMLQEPPGFYRKRPGTPEKQPEVADHASRVREDLDNKISLPRSISKTT